MKKPVVGICLAAVLWTIMFSPWTAPHVNFWIMMTCSGLALTLYSTWAAPGWWKDLRFGVSDILFGVGLAAVLWGVFRSEEHTSELQSQ